ncbi:MAG TPA: hemin uptake protein HemP [Xanthobacteraceae bacterium]|nr:hemin uptake protein HemP [Xanthobacteraceae bacterium]
MNSSDDRGKEKNQRDDERIGVQRSITLIDNCVGSQDLFVGNRDVVIRHGREVYHLRLTAQNKLILTK